MTNHLVNSVETNRLKPVFKELKKTARTATAWNVAAIIALAGGMITLFGTVFLIVFEYFSGRKGSGGWLLFVALPLLMLGAHCLDKYNEIDKARRLEYCRQHGLTDKECAEQKLTDEI